MHKSRVFQCAWITIENYWTVLINVLLRSINFIHQQMHSLLNFDNVLKFTLKINVTCSYMFRSTIIIREPSLEPS